MGGDLFQLMKGRRHFEEHEARFFMAEIIHGMEYLHEKGILYRDLKVRLNLTKPENIMLDWQGHVKIVDFGLSKKVDNKTVLTHSFVGSQGYFSPEVSLNKGHNYMSDVYNMGILLFDILHGYLPFHSFDPKANSMRPIKNQKLIFRENLSPEVKDLMSQILVADPNKRLGGENKVSAILFHPWFKMGGIIGMSLEKLIPPIVPDISTPNYDEKLNLKLPSIIRSLEGRKWLTLRRLCGYCISKARPFLWFRLRHLQRRRIVLGGHR